MKTASVVLLCLMFVSVIYGFSVALSASLNTQIPETSDWVVTRLNHAQVSAPIQHSLPHPTILAGEPIDSPKPN